MLLNPLFCFSFSCSAAPLDLHSFPTRRSSDLSTCRAATVVSTVICMAVLSPFPFRDSTHSSISPQGRVHTWSAARSEEHTSELQSLRHLVCRLLLEKKKKKKSTRHIIEAYTPN